MILHRPVSPGGRRERVRAGDRGAGGVDVYTFSMKTIELKVPDGLADRLEELVEAGWFRDQGEIARLALAEFVSRHRFELQERFQREDIEWALRAADQAT